MNKQILKGNWNEAKGKIKEKWGELTDDEVNRVSGEVDQLIGVLQKRYGLSKEEAEQEIEAWEKASGW